MTMVHAAALLCAMACGQDDDEPRKLSAAERDRIFMLAVQIQGTEGLGRDTEGMVWLREIVQKRGRIPTVEEYRESRRRAARLAEAKRKVAGGMVCGAAFVIGYSAGRSPLSR